MSGSCLHRSWEVSSVPDGILSGGAEKGNRNPAIHAVEKSDAPVVPEKPPNKVQPPYSLGAGTAEAVEGRGAAKGNAEESPAGRTPGRETALTGLQRVRETAKLDRRLKFTALLHHITPSLLVESFYDLNKTAAVGVDGVTWRDYENILYERVHELHREIHTGAYRAQASRRTYILKTDGKLRPLGIAAVEDKIVQQAVVKVLNAIYEEDFLGFSYGFRQGRGQHDALDALWMGIGTKPIRWILDADISAYFDTIDHSRLLQQLERRIADRSVLRLIRLWLRCPVVDEDDQGRRRTTHPRQGTPQGGVISPLLANVYLHHVLDTWFQEEVMPRLRGRTSLVRFADDAVIVCEREDDAHRVMKVLPKRFGKYGLTLHPEKTRLVPFRRPEGTMPGGKSGAFDLLGFTHFWARSRKGSWVVRRKTAAGRFTRAVRAVAVWCKVHRHRPIAEQHQELARKLKGHGAYYGITGNASALARFRYEVVRVWRKWLDRRSSKACMKWDRFNRLLQRYPLPVPVAIHSICRRGASP